ncbi:MAG TPA: YheU family protein [Steroidobacteraceae bacterium]|nr:YheU family protein [Steroidobacteraceae bacterium]
MALPGNPAPPGVDAAALTEPIFIPHAELSAEALRGVIESFVLREGTDYGEHEYSLEQKVAHVRAQLERGQARILFDSETNTVTLVPVQA